MCGSIPLSATNFTAGYSSGELGGLISHLRRVRSSFPLPFNKRGTLHDSAPAPVLFRMNEGVIKFQYEHTFCCDEFDVTNIEKCRQQLLKTGLIGRDPNRYGGYSFGNVSERRGREILITASQTSQVKVMDDLGYVFIERADVIRNTVWSKGAAKPSSESLTHMCVYWMDPNIGGVAHVHSPKLWARTDLLRTSPNAQYGSREMVNETMRLFEETDIRERRIFAMGGHEDGIVSFGPDIQSAVDILLKFCEV